MSEKFEDGGIGRAAALAHGLQALADAAGSWDRAAYSSIARRDRAPLLGDHLRADVLVELDAAVSRTHLRAEGQDGTRGDHRPVGTLLIDSTPPATTRSYRPETTPDAGEVHGLPAGSALPLHHRAGNPLRPPRGEDSVAVDVDRLLAHLADTAPDHVIDQRGVDACPLGEGAQYVRREVTGWISASEPPAPASGRPRR